VPEDHHPGIAPEDRHPGVACQPEPPVSRLVRADAFRCEAEGLLADLHVFCTALISSGSDADGAAAAMLRRISALSAELGLAIQSLERVVIALDDADYGAFLAGASPGAPSRWAEMREARQSRASEAEERTIALLGAEAYRGWANLYQQLSAELVVSVPADDVSGGVRELGIAEAVGLLVEPDGAVRKRAWGAIRQAWEPHETTVAAILSNLASYRLKLCRLRPDGHDEAGGDFLAPTLSENRLTRPVLDGLIATLDARRPQLRRAAGLMASLLGKERLDPWDLAASGPEAEQAPEGMPLSDAFALIRTGFCNVDGSMGRFVDDARARRWIDARTHAAGRRLGAYQTSVRRGRHPLVFTNYQGRRLDVITLAHELGHAYHYWLLRDEPPECHRLPATLSECLSSFAEMLVRDQWLAAHPNDPAERRALAWAECQTITAFLVNMPASFTFERRLYTERRKGAFTAADLRRMLGEAWSHWFGPALASHDDRGWVRKPHFASTHWFYNYPYVIGFLLAVLLRDRQTRLGSDFFPFFREFARATAYLSVDELLSQYFGMAGDPVTSWDTALRFVEQRIEYASNLAGRALPG
jgi:oligoendopeptidase F